MPVIERKIPQDDVTIFVPSPPSVFSIILNLSGTGTPSNGKNHKLVKKNFCFDVTKFLAIVRNTDFGKFTGIAFDIDYSRKAAKGKLLKKLAEAIRENKTLIEKHIFILLNLSCTNEFDETIKQDLSCATSLQGPPAKSWRRKPAEVVKQAHKNFDIGLFKGIPCLFIQKHWLAINNHENYDMDFSKFEDKTMHEAAQSFGNNFAMEEYFAAVSTTESKLRLFQYTDSKLFVVCNSYSFENGEKDRVGSEINIESVKQEAMKWRAPIVVMPNIQKHDFLMCLFKILETGDFSHIKQLHTFIMSHGYKNDVMCTGDGQYYEIKKELIKISANVKINSAIFYLVACRGKKPTIFSERDENLDFEEIFNPNAEWLNKGICIWQSTKKDYQSPRKEFVEAVVEVLRKYRESGEPVPFENFVKDVTHTIKKRYEFKYTTEFNYNSDILGSMLEGLIKAPDGFNSKNNQLFNEIKEVANKFNTPYKIIVY